MTHAKSSSSIDLNTARTPASIPVTTVPEKRPASATIQEQIIKRPKISSDNMLSTATTNETVMKDPQIQKERGQGACNVISRSIAQNVPNTTLTNGAMRTDGKGQHQSTLTTYH